MHSLRFITARNEVGARFLHVSVILFTGGGGEWYRVVSQHAFQVVSQHALQVSRPTPKGEVEGSGQGGLQAHTWGVRARGVWRTPPRWLLMQAVRILLECILVNMVGLHRISER